MKPKPPCEKILTKNFAGVVHVWGLRQGTIQCYHIPSLWGTIWTENNSRCLPKFDYLFKGLNYQIFRCSKPPPNFFRISNPVIFCQHLEEKSPCPDRLFFVQISVLLQLHQISKYSPSIAIQFWLGWWADENRVSNPVARHIEKDWAMKYNHAIFFVPILPK